MQPSCSFPLRSQTKPRPPSLPAHLMPHDAEAKAPPPYFGKPPTSKSPPAGLAGPTPRPRKAPPPIFVDRSDPKWRPKPPPPPLPKPCPTEDQDPPAQALPKTIVLASPKSAPPPACPKPPSPKAQLSGMTVRCHLCETTYLFDEFNTEKYCFVCRSDAISFTRSSCSHPVRL